MTFFEIVRFFQELICCYSCAFNLIFSPFYCYIFVHIKWVKYIYCL